MKEYVDKQDDNYAWSDTGIRMHGLDPLHLVKWTGYVLNFTSQQWLTSDDSSQSIWWHILVIVIPNEVRYPNSPFLWITGGDNDDDPIPKVASQDMIVVGDFAVQTKTIGAALFQVPNSPITFPIDPTHESRSADAAIAFTWWHFLNDPSSKHEWLLNLPMTKASVRAMDTITAFMTSDSSPQEIKDLNSDPSQFLVAGASKRAWVTWNTAAVDPRVMGIVPVVMNNLNAAENLHHHYRAYGGWSFAFQDYWKMNITLQLDDPKFQTMMDIVDMYEYRDKILMPKLVCDATMDEFFLLDDTWYWWNDMPYANELNHYVLVPNAEHSQATGILELLPAVTTWARELLRADSEYTNKRTNKNGREYLSKTIEERNSRSLDMIQSFSNIPRFNWTIEEKSGDIMVKSNIAPTSVRIWHATTCNRHRRDFRIVNLDDPCTCGIKLPEIAGFKGLCSNLFAFWTAEELEETEPGSLTWVAHKDGPILGRWLAFFVDLQFDGPKPDIPYIPRNTSVFDAWPIGCDGIYDFTTTVSIIPNTFPYSDCYSKECYGHLV